MPLGRRAAARAVAVTAWLGLAVLTCVIGVASGEAKTPPPKPLITEKPFARSNWVFSQKFISKDLEKKQQVKHIMNLRRDGSAKFVGSGPAEAYWRVERRLSAAQKEKDAKAKRVKNPFEKKKEPEPTEGVDYWVMDVPQDMRHETIWTYEIPVAWGKHNPQAVRWAREGSIFRWNQSDEIEEPEEYGVPPKSRRKIGTFRVGVKTLPPFVDNLYLVQ